MATILGVGNVSLDIINEVSTYPVEDSEIRAQSSAIRRGGNIANTLSVLRQFGHRCDFAGALAGDQKAAFIRADLTARSIALTGCETHPQATSPTSWITLSKANGSRTIVHYRDLPEYSMQGFRQIDLKYYDWIHFEGRNPCETHKMLQKCRTEQPGLKVSLEIEKERENIESLFPLAATIFFSRAFVSGRGYDNAESFLRIMAETLPDTTLVCPWGDQGVYAFKAGKCMQAQAFSPARLIDTIGAGDVFIAGFINASVNKLSLCQSLEAACMLAGKKCGQLGFENLV